MSLALPSMEEQDDAQEPHVEDSLEEEEVVCSEEDDGGEEEQVEEAEVPTASELRKRKRGPARQSEEQQKREQREQVHDDYKSKVPSAMQVELDLSNTTSMYNLYKVQALSGLVCGMEPIIRVAKVRRSI
jgi:hypothetical protein